MSTATVGTKLWEILVNVPGRNQCPPGTKPPVNLTFTIKDKRQSFSFKKKKKGKMFNNRSSLEEFLQNAADRRKIILYAKSELHKEVN